MRYSIIWNQMNSLSHKCNNLIFTKNQYLQKTWNFLNLSREVNLYTLNLRINQISLPLIKNRPVPTHSLTRKTWEGSLIFYWIGKSSKKLTKRCCLARLISIRLSLYSKGYFTRTLTSRNSSQVLKNRNQVETCTL